MQVCLARTTCFGSHRYVTVQQTEVHVLGLLLLKGNRSSVLFSRKITSHMSHTFYLDIYTRPQLSGCTCNLHLASLQLSIFTCTVEYIQLHSYYHIIIVYCFNFKILSHFSQCYTTGVNNAVVCAILSVGWYI